LKVKEARRIEAEIDNEISYAQESSNYLEHSTVVSAQVAGAKSWDDQQEKLAALVAAKFTIRTAINTFNYVNGLNDQMAVIAELEMHKAHLSEYSSRGVRTNHSYSSGNKDTYREGLSTAKVDAIRAETRVLSRKIASLKDSCNGINSQGTLDFGNGFLTMLKVFGFID
jgi:hypothetical protein